MTSTRVRPYTWIALYNDGTQAWETDFSSLNNVPRREDIVKLALVRSSDVQDPNGHYTVVLPTGTEPVCFSRVSIHVTADGEEQGRDEVSVIGWRTSTDTLLLFVYEDGSCAVLNHDPDTH